MAKRKIILYYPATHHEKFYSFFWLPYSILTIASIVPEYFETILIDANAEEIEPDFSRLTVDCVCVGISVMIGQQINGAIEFSKKIKRANPQITVVWGGPHPSILPDITIHYDNVDVLVLGQGEFVFRELLHVIDNKNEWGTINGLVYKHEGRIVKTPANKLQNKSILPEFPWHLVDITKYIRTDEKIGSRILNYVSSQGCPFYCKFCSEVALYNQQWKSYGSERIFRDIKYLVQHYAIEAIKFYDANFLGNPKIAFEFLELLIKSNLCINWAASIHPKALSNLSQEKWMMLKKSNCKRLLIGAESGSIKILNLIQKRITPDTIIDIAIKCAFYGIAGSFSFIVGYPDSEIEKEIQETLDIAKKIREISEIHEVKIHFYTPFPGTELFSSALKAGFKEPKTLEDWANIDYYNISVPWINKRFETIIHDFNSKNCPYVHI